MKYSVWNDRTRLYDYYESPGTPPTHAPPATHVHGRSRLGATPDEAAWPLPGGAKKVGQGDKAVGRIAAPAFRRAMGGTFDSLLDPKKLLVFSGISLGFWLLRREIKGGRR